MPTATKQERLEARITDSQKKLFRRAATAEGKSLSEFVVSTLQEAASRIVRQGEVLELSERDRRRFVEVLQNPPAPNKALRQAAKAHIRLISRT